MQIKNITCKLNIVYANTIFTIFPATNLLRCLKFLVRMNCNIFNLQPNF